MFVVQESLDIRYCSRHITIRFDNLCCSKFSDESAAGSLYTLPRSSYDFDNSSVTLYNDAKDTGTHVVLSDLHRSRISSHEVNNGNLLTKLWLWCILVIRVNAVRKHPNTSMSILAYSVVFCTQPSSRILMQSSYAPFTRIMKSAPVTRARSGLS